MSGMPVHRAQAALLRALEAHAGPFAVRAVSSRGWASATFEGSRHRLRLALDGPDAGARGAALAATLDEADLPLRAAFVADLTVAMESDDHGPVLAIAALVIDEA